jgi:O-antigen/teichoic acid export membrane protein
VNDRLLSTGVLARSTAWSLAALGLPSFVALVTLPWIVHGFGTERFGVLALAWTLIGYLGVFDFGLGRALTRLVAESLGTEDPNLGRTVWTALQLMAAAGICGGAVLAIAGQWLLIDVIGVPSELRVETRTTVYLLSACLPVVVLSTAFRGILEANQNFRRSSAVRIALGVATFAVPALLLFMTRDLAVHVAALVAVRVLALVAFAALALDSVNWLGALHGFDRLAARRLLSFGAWITISNIISPIMASFDRFLVGGLISVAAVSFYAAPFDVLARTLIFPGAIASVLFPAFSAAGARRPERLPELLWGATDIVFYALFPVLFVTSCFASELLQLWLGADFAEQSSGVVRWLCVGVLANGLAALPYAFVQGLGRSDLTAKLHIAEIPGYLVALVWLAKSFGIAGVALAWSLRTTADMLLLYGFARRQCAAPIRQLFAHIAIPILAMPLMLVGYFVEGFGARLVVSAAVLSGLAVLGWPTVSGRWRAWLTRLEIDRARSADAR